MFERVVIRTVTGVVITRITIDNYCISVVDRTNTKRTSIDNFEVNIDRRHLPERLGHLVYVGYGYGDTRKEAMNIAFDTVRDQTFLKDMLWVTIRIT